MAVRLESKNRRYVGRSTDIKPSPFRDGDAFIAANELGAGSSFLEEDTGRIYRWTGFDWATNPSGAQGGERLAVVADLRVGLEEVHELNPVPILQIGVADVDVRSTTLPTGYAILGDGRKTVTTAATREQMSAQACKSVLITAETDNTGIVVVGGSTVVAALATRQGTPLNAGDSAVFPVSNVNLLYLDVTVSGDGVTFTWFN